MNDIMSFQKPEFGTVRTLMINNEPWFVAKDVCDCLDIQNSRDAVSSLRDKDKNTVAITDGNRGNPNQTVISVSGLYELVFLSRKPEAKAFKYWVVDEVLPSIMKHGIYATENVVEQMLKDPASFITLLQNYQAEQQERKRLAKENTQLAYEKETLLADNMYLNDQLGYGKTWKQVKGIKWLGKYFNLKDTPIWSILGKAFTALSTDLGYNIETTPSPENGTVNLYHVDVVDYFEKLLETRDPDVDTYIKNPRWFNPNYRTC